MMCLLMWTVIFLFLGEAYKPTTWTDFYGTYVSKILFIGYVRMIYPFHFSVSVSPYISSLPPLRRSPFSLDNYVVTMCYWTYVRSFVNCLAILRKIFPFHPVLYRIYMFYFHGWLSYPIGVSPFTHYRSLGGAKVKYFIFFKCQKFPWIICITSIKNSVLF